MNATYFSGPETFRAWLLEHHDTEEELLVGYYKVATGKASMTWPESVDEALCFGWIDGVRRRLDEESYCIRFTPRRPGSTWSAVNIERVEELDRQGRLHAAGRKAYDARRETRSKIYAYEQKNPKLDPGYEKELRSNREAWTFFRTQAPWYRRTASWWVMSAKREATRTRRLAQLIEDSSQGRTLAHLTRDKT
ncbi:MAG: YdeI/OmpD-associated family protein [Acidobacteria bacterium]|nr:YdeI/OmpD-associated family protein [Acidobacteriota bacterium]